MIFYGEKMSTPASKTKGLDTKLLLRTLVAFKRGDFSVRMPDDWTGVDGKIADTLNEIIGLTERTSEDFARVCSDN